MELVAVSVGGPREVEWRGRSIRTSIFKTPVSGRVRVGRLNLTGDEQSDLSVHGGPDKAVYVYPSEYYDAWRSELPTADLGWGAFGENFTSAGLQDDTVRIGDRYRIGTAEFVVTQPRIPCYKLGVRFGRPDMVKRFMHAGRNGFYLAVAREGEVGAGDPIEQTAEGASGITVADVVALYAADAANQALLARASEDPGLPESWREYFRKRRWEPDA